VRVYIVGFTRAVQPPVFVPLFVFRWLSCYIYMCVRVYTVGFTRIRVTGLGVRVDPRFRCLSSGDGRAIYIYMCLRVYTVRFTRTWVDL